MRGTRRPLTLLVFIIVYAMAVPGSIAAVNFRDTMVLAPMVRVSNLPLRLLSLDHGADLVWTEEIIGQKIAGCNRVVNEELGTVEYWSPEIRGNPSARIFYTTERERSKLVFQAGVGNAEDALAACQTVLNDISVFDINCGCPKTFSVQGGMGAALLKEPERIADMIKTLKRNVNIPITAKLRLLESEADSVRLLQMLEKAGADALTVHCRYTSQRSSVPAHQSLLNPLVKSISIPVLGNGDVTSYREAQAWRESSGCAGIMVARGAVENTSCFRKEGMLPVRKVADQHIRYCIDYDESWKNVKFIYQRHFQAVTGGGGSPMFQAITDAKGMYEVAEAFELGKYYKEVMAARKEKRRVMHAKRGRGERGEGDDEEEAGGGATKQKPNAPAGWSCPECGEEFVSRNAFGRHCGETGHRKS